MKYTKYFVPLFIILVVLYVLFEKKDPKPPEGVFHTIGDYFAVQIDKVDKIDISENDTRIVLLERGGAWYLDEPLKAPANSENTENLLKGILTNPLHRVIPAHEADDFSAYGLETPHRSITLLAGNSPLLDLRLGERSVTGSDFYARKTAGGEILLTAVQLDAILNFDPDHYRSRNPFQIDENLVSELRFSYPDKPSIVIQKDKTAGDWNITEPENFKALETRVKMLLGQLRSLEIVKFLGRRLPDDDAHGLDSPVVTFELVYDDDSSTDSITLKLGDMELEHNAVYARLSIMPEEDVLVESFIRHRLILDLDQWREYKLFTIDPLKIETVNVRERGVSSLTVMQTRRNEWQMVSPGSGRVDTDQLIKLFTSLAGMKPSRFLSESDISALGDDQHGFETFTAKIEINLKDSSERYDITIGEKTDDGFYVTTSDITGGYVIDESFVDTLLEITNLIRKR